MTTFLLVRHAAHDNVGAFLAGRTPGIRLGPDGLAQAARLGERLKRHVSDALFASPRERTRQTAEFIAAAAGIDGPAMLDEIDEIDFGRWSGRTFDDLNGDPGWRAWNERRSLARTPGGESMLDVQRRCVGAMAALAARHPDGAVTLVSHADVIKSAVMYCLGMATDAWWRIEISPASVTRIAIDAQGARVTGLNEVVD